MQNRQQVGIYLWCRELNPVLWDNLEEWDEEEDGGVGSGGSGQMYTCGWFMLMYSRNQHNVVKQLSSKTKKN